MFRSIFLKGSALKDIFYSQRTGVEGKRVTCSFILQRFGQGGGGGEEKDCMAVHRLFAQAGGNEESYIMALDKCAREGVRAEGVGADPEEGCVFAFMLCLLAGVHFFLEVAHGAARLIFVAGGAFFFLVSGLLCLIGGLAGGRDALGDQVEPELFEGGFEGKLLGIVHGFAAVWIWAGVVR